MKANKKLHQYLESTTKLEAEVFFRTGGNQKHWNLLILGGYIRTMVEPVTRTFSYPFCSECYKHQGVKINTYAASKLGFAA